MKVRIIQGFSNYTPGQVFDDWPDGMSEIFIAKGLIERVAEAPAVEVAADEPAVEQADASPKRKRK